MNTTLPLIASILTISGSAFAGNVRVAHLSPDAPAVDVRVNGAVAFQNLSFNEVSDYADLPAGALVFALDETGKPMSSLDFSRVIETARDDGARDLVFLIGSADGHDRPALPQGARMLSFGKATWPHKLVRVMLAEQIYRAASVLAGAPYHREG